MGCRQRDHREKRRSLHRPASRKTLGRRLLGAMAGRKKTKAKPSYIETLERAWRVHVAPKWGMREVQSITHDEVQVWVSALAESKSASVVLRAEGILRALLAKAKADKCITRQSMRWSRIAQEASQEARVSDHRPIAGPG